MPNVGQYSASLTLDIGSIRASVKEMQNLFSGLKLDKSLQGSLDSVFGNLETKMKDYEKLMKSNLGKSVNVGNLRDQFQAIQGDITNLNNLLAKVGQKPIKLKLNPQDITQFNKLTQQLQDYEAAQERITKLEAERATQLKKQAGNARLTKQEADSLNDLLKATNDVVAAKKELQRQQQAARADAIKDTNAIFGKVKPGATLDVTTPIKEQVSELSKLYKEVEVIQKLFQEAQANPAKMTEAMNVGSKLNITSLQQANQLLTEITAQQQSLGATSKNVISFSNQINALDQFKTELESIQKELDKTFLQTGAKDAQALSAQISSLIGQLSKLGSLTPDQQNNILTQLRTALSGIQADATKTKASLNEAFTGAVQGEKVAEQFDMIASRIKYTFSLVNGFYLFQRAIKSAFNTVKELDASMNSIAVVTKMTTGDLWDQIDTYNKLASAMGATVKGSYDVAKLYYQQGKAAEDVNVLTTQTLKLSRISGLEYSKATDYMTAALNGFKLGVEDASHVVDVYSNLAAHAAVSQEEISYAMTKTASIANNAGMKIETTAALLAQMIETTREAPENIGTAMKTIIARFAEMKTAIGNTFTDEEGEVVNVNRVEKALRSAGVQLRDAITGEIRPIDDVFLELSSKWDSLSKNTQRYVATIAAGSRQQSRFIAMMDNYQRTLELVDLAQNSAGASDEQFAKTLDSLESKLNKLSNAWVEFTTGITDSDFIKAAVDALTGLLKIINKITSGPGGGLGKILTLFAGFKLSGTVVRGLVDRLKGVISGSGASFQQAGVVAGRMFAQGMASQATQSWQTTLRQGFSGTTGKAQMAASYAAKRLQQQMVTALAEGNGQLTIDSIDKLFSGAYGGKNFKKTLQKSMGTITPVMKDFTDQVSQEFLASTEGLSTDMQNLGKQAIDGFNKGIEQGDLAKATRTLKDGFHQMQLQAQKEIDNFWTQTRTKNGKTQTYGDILTEKNGQFVYKSNGQQVADPTIAAQIKEYQAAQGFLKQGGKLSAESTNKLTSSFSNLGSAASSAGIAILQISNMLASAGFNGAAKVVGSIGSAFMTLGSIITAVGAAMTSSIIVPLAIIAAAIAAVVGIGVLIYNASPEKKLKDLTTASKDAENVADVASTSYKTLLTTIEDNQNAVEAIGDLTAGTVEFNQAILEANSSLMTLLNRFPELYGTNGNTSYLTTDKYGLMSLTSEGQSYLTDLMYQGQVTAQASAGMARSAVNKQQNIVDKKQLLKTFNNTVGQSLWGHDASKFSDVITQLTDYMLENNLSASMENFWNDPKVSSMIDQLVISPYGMTKSQEAKVHDEFAAALDNYVSNANQREQANQTDYKQIGRTYATSNADLMDNIFVDATNGYLAQTFEEMSDAKTVKKGDLYSRKALREKYGKGSYKKNLLAQYADLYSDIGFKYQDGEVVDSTGQTVSGLDSVDNILNQIAAYENADAYKTQLESLMKVVQAQNKDGQFTKLVSESETLTQSDYENLTSLLNTFDLTDESQLAAYKVLAQQINDSYNQRADTGKKLLKSILTKNGTVDQLNAIQSEIPNMTEQQMSAITSVLDGLSNNFSEIVSGQFVDKTLGASLDDILKYSDSIDNIDFTDSITSLATMEDAIKQADGAEKLFLEDLQQQMRDSMSQKQLFEDLYTADAFKDGLASLEKFYTTNDKITGDNVREVAKETSILDEYLSQSGISAEALAKIIENMQFRDIGISDITNGLIEAVNAAEQLQGVLGKTFDYIDNHDWSRSYTEAGTYAQGLASDILDNLSKGAIGDPAMWEKFDFLFGQAITDNLQKEINQAMETGTDPTAAHDAIQALLTPYGQALTEMSEEGNLSAIFQMLNIGKNGISFGTEADSAFSGFFTETGFDITEVKAGTAEIVAQLQEMYGVTEEMAGLMLMDQLAYESPDMVSQIQKFDIGKAIDAYISATAQDAYLRQQDIDNLLKLYPSLTQEMVNAANTAKKPIIDLASDWATDGATALTELNKAFEGVGTNLKDQLLFSGALYNTKDNGIHKNIIDYEKMSDVLQSYGATAAEADAAINSFITDQSNGIDGLTTKVRRFDKEQGKFIDDTITGTSVENLQQQLSELQTTNLSDAISSSIGEIVVTFGSDVTPLTSALAQVQADYGSMTVKVYYDPQNSPTDGADNNAAGTGILGASTSQLSTVGERGYEAIQTSNGAYLVGLHGTETAYLNRGDIVYNHAATRELLAHKKAFRRYARGSTGIKYRGPALLGEDGYELVQTSTGAYLAGQYGPEMTNLNPNDIVYTHEQTQAILNTRKNKEVPRFQTGTLAYLDGWTFDAGEDATSGGSDAAKKSKDWENKFDKEYNLLQIIEDTLRRQEQLQESMDESAEISATAVADNLTAQTELMEAELANSKLLLDRRKKEVEDYLAQNEQYKDYGTYDLISGLISIDWDKINTSGNKDVEEYINKLEELQENVQDAEDKIDEANQTLQDIADQGKDTYFELQDDIYDAIVSREQSIIDQLSANNDAINDSNSRLIDSLQTSLDQQRQDRDNSNTEADIAENQRRLALLQRDTSGTYALEIKKLQEEIKSAQEDYTDTLVDQAIQELQDSYDLAAEAREREIEMLQNQKDWREENGFYWTEVINLLSSSAYGNATDQVAIDQLMSLFGKYDEDYIGTSEDQREQYIADLTSQFSEALGWFWTQDENQSIATRTETIDNDDGSTTTNIYRTITYYDPNGEASVGPEELVSNITTSPENTASSTSTSSTSDGNNKTGWTGEATFGGKSFAKFYPTATSKSAANQMAYNELKSAMQQLWASGLWTKSYATAYATGGLADYTGPAWVDGTKSRPELVLDQGQTATFIQFTNALDNLAKGGFNSGSSAPTSIQVDISFDKLDPTTNIDEVADKVEKAIIKKAAYRNVTVLGRGR